MCYMWGVSRVGLCVKVKFFLCVVCVICVWCVLRGVVCSVCLKVKMFCLCCFVVVCVPCCFVVCVRCCLGIVVCVRAAWLCRRWCYSVACCVFTHISFHRNVHKINKNSALLHERFK